MPTRLALTALDQQDGAPDGPTLRDLIEALPEAAQFNATDFDLAVELAECVHGVWSSPWGDPSATAEQLIAEYLEADMGIAA